MAIDLMKKRIEDVEERKKVSLAKHGITTDLVANVYVEIDISGSMSGFYPKTIQRIFEILYPIVSVLDPDKKMPVYTFSEDCRKLDEYMTIDNYKDYVYKEISRKEKSYYWNGTNYTPAFKRVMQDIKYDSRSIIRRFFDWLFRIPAPENNIPSLVIFITDGDCWDSIESETFIRRASKFPVFWQTIGVGNSNFKFLKKLDTMSGRFIDNANFKEFSSFENMTDNEVYSLIFDEFPVWYKEAKTKKIF